MRTQRTSKKGKKDERRPGWDEWQRYVQKETQRLMKKGEKGVVEVVLSDTDSRAQREQKEETPGSDLEHGGMNLGEGRRPPVPGVSREEAIQVNDDVIGRTVKPFRVQDYRDIRPMTSTELFKPVPDAVHREIEPERIEEPTSPDGEYVETVEEEVVQVIERAPVQQEIKAKPQTSPRTKAQTTPVAVVEPKAPVKEPSAGAKRRDKKKKHQEDELALFSDDIAEHSASGRRRLMKKGRLEREELIEKLLDPVISLEEAATLIGVCKTSVRRYTNRDELECLRTPGQQRRFKLSQVLAFVKKREEEEKARRSRASKEK